MLEIKSAKGRKKGKRLWIIEKNLSQAILQSVKYKLLLNLLTHITAMLVGASKLALKQTDFVKALLRQKV